MIPGRNGITMVIDTGLPTGAFTDLIESHGEFIDLVKFGWGTALVTRDMDRKTGVLKMRASASTSAGPCSSTSCGPASWPLPGPGRALRRHAHRGVQRDDPAGSGRQGRHVRRLAGIRPVLSEVGYKDAERSALLSPADWVDALAEDLDAGASMVITEARESGRSGIARADGRMRTDVLSAVQRAINPALVMFEAPTKDLQVEMVRSVGPAVNLGTWPPPT